jgi:hypothetical protein
MPISVTSGSSPLRGELEIVVLWLVCVAPLWLRGLRGKKSTPIVGWEVPVKSQRSESGRGMERARQRLGAVDLGYDTHAFTLNGRLIWILRLHFCTFIV